MNPLCCGHPSSFNALRSFFVCGLPHGSFVVAHEIKTIDNSTTSKVIRTPVLVFILFVVVFNLEFYKLEEYNNPNYPQD
jgi:hypothetical protein